MADKRCYNCTPTKTKTPGIYLKLNGPRPGDDLEKEEIEVAKKEQPLTGNVEIVKTGDRIILPVGMSYSHARNWLLLKEQEEENVVSLYAEIPNASPIDALVNFHRALGELYGWTHANPIPGFFGDKPPTMITVETGLGKTIQVPFGPMSVPSMREALFQPQIGEVLILMGSAKQKHLVEFERLVQKTKELVKTNSIYKGQAIRVSWEWERDEQPFHPMHNAPKFIPPSTTDKNSLIFSKEVYHSINLGLFIPIEQAVKCRELGIPLKRGILLEGPYGTGKSLTASVAAKKAIDNGWSFIYLDSVLDLENGLRFARQYAPAVVFVEDIDKALDERSIETNQILELLDGIDTKGSEIITIFTTNFVEKLDRAFLRPGRLDTVVSVRPPDAEAAVRLVKLYGNSSLGVIDEAVIGEALAGTSPAMIREIMESSKLSALAHSVDEPKVNTDDILAAVQMKKNHSALLQEKKTEEPARVTFSVPVGTNVKRELMGVTKE